MLFALILAAGVSSSFEALDLSRYATPNEKISYTQNLGQWDKKAKFMARYDGVDVWVTSTGVTYAFNHEVAPAKKNGFAPRREKPTPSIEVVPIGVEFVGATGKGKPVGLDAKRKLSNYYRGRDARKWVVGAQSVGAAMIEDLYPGIDLVSYVDRRERRPRYDLIVHPGADPKQIRMRYTGAKNLRIDKEGQLCYETQLGKVVERQQVAIQSGTTAPYRFVAAQEVAEDGTVTFNVDGYRKDRELVIDPLIYSTFVGGTGSDSFHRFELDSSDTNLMCGETSSTDFPGATNSLAASRDAVVSSVSSDGQTLLWSTYFGGDGADMAFGMTLDASGDLYVGGQTDSTDLPVTDSSTNAGDIDAFFSKFSGSTGTLIYAKYLGGANDDSIESVSLNGTHPVITGYTGSTNFPATVGAFQTTFGGGLVDAFVGQMNEDGSTEYLTYLGGDGAEVGTGISVEYNRANVAGYTDSTNFPAGTTTPFQPNLAGGYDGFAAVVRSDFGQLLYSTYIGGSSDDALLAIVATPGFVLVGGRTHSNDYPGVGGLSFQSERGGTMSGTFAWLDVNLGMVGSTYFGATGPTDTCYVNSIQRTDANEYLIGGNFVGSGLPKPVPQATITSRAMDGFVAKFAPYGVLYTRAVGGASNDTLCAARRASDGSIRVAGETLSSDFPVVSALQSIYGGNGDGFLASINPDFGPTIDSFDTSRGSTPHIAGGVGLSMQVTVNMTNTNEDYNLTLSSEDATMLLIDGNPSSTVHKLAGSTSHTFTVSAVGTSPSSSPVFLTASVDTGARTDSTNVYVDAFVTGVVLQHPTLTGSKKMTGYLQVSEPPAVRTVVSMSDDNDDVTVSPNAYVEIGQTQSNPFTIFSNPVYIPREVRVKASFGTDNSYQVAFDLVPAKLVAIRATPLTVHGGQSTVVVVRFDGDLAYQPTVNVTSSDPSVVANFSVDVPTGTNQGSAVVPTASIVGSAVKNVYLTANFAGEHAAGKIRVVPSGLASFQVLKAGVAEGNSIPVRVTLFGPSAGDTLVTITSAAPGLIPNATVTVPNGQTSVQTTIPSAIPHLNRARNVRLVATLGALHKSAGVAVHPAVLSVVADPASVVGGNDSIGEVELFEPLEYDLTLNLSSTSSLAHLDSSTFFLAAGSVGGTFPIHTVHRNVVKTAKIAVTKGAWYRAVYLTIRP